MKDLGIALLASLGVVAQIAVVVLVVGGIACLVSPGARSTLAPVRRTLGQSGVWLAFTTAVVATLGSLWLSNGAGFIPCHLCWLQRYVMYPLVAVLLVVALVRRWWLTLACVVVPLVGLGISTYHVWVENHPDQLTAACRKGVPCSVKWINEFGYITIPTLAGSAFALIAVLLAWAASAQKAPGVER